MITVKDIMDTKPCEAYPRRRVEALFELYGPFKSWDCLARATKKVHPLVPIPDLRYTAYKAASERQREVAVRRSTAVALAAQIVQHPFPEEAVRKVRSALLAWTSGDCAPEDIHTIAGIAAQNLDGNYTTSACSVLAAATCASTAYRRRCPPGLSDQHAQHAAEEADRANTWQLPYGNDRSQAPYWDSLFYICRLLDEGREVESK